MKTRQNLVRKICESFDLKTKNELTFDILSFAELNFSGFIPLFGQKNKKIQFFPFSKNSNEKKN